MGITTRDRQGRVASRYSDRALYDLVRQVARHVDREDPESLTQPAFDEARADVGHPEAPSARAICMRLGDRERSLPWRDVLSKALDETTNRDHSEGRRRGAERSDHLGRRHLHFALNLVARELGDSPSADRYDATRRSLILRDRRRRSEQRLIEELLPTSGQLLRIAKDELGLAEAPRWNDALLLAGLEPPASPPGRKPTRGVPLLEAIDVFVDANGEWPSYNRLRAFMRELDCRLAERDGRSWAEYLDAGKERRLERGADCPEEDRPRASGRGNHKTLRFPESIPTHWPRRGAPTHTREECLEALQAYLDSLDAKQNPTTKSYMAFASANGLPSHQALQRHGGFKALLAGLKRA